MGIPVCELCKSTNFVKEEGMFVCQGCGTKYTLEEAQKLMAADSAANPLQGVQAPAPVPAPAPASFVQAAGVAQQPQAASPVLPAQMVPAPAHNTTIVVLSDGSIVAPETASAFAPERLTADMGLRGVNNYVCQGWQLMLDEYEKIEHPTKEEHEKLINTAKACLLIMDNACMADTSQYVYNAIVYRNCTEIVESACDAEFHEQKEDGTWKKDSLTFESKLNLPGQKESWDDKYQAARARIVEEFENANPDNVAARQQLAAKESEISEELGDLKDEKRSKGFFNFAEKREVKERMAPVKEELAQVRSQIRDLERVIDKYVEERLDEHAGSYVMLDF